MPYKDPARMAECMRQRRAAKSGKVNVNPSVNRKPVNHDAKISPVLGSYENGYWVGICPACNHHNRMDPKRSYRPADRCKHFRQLLKPGTASEFIFLRGLSQSSSNPRRVTPLTQNVKPGIERYLIPCSRNKYQHVVYHVKPDGSKSIMGSFSKGKKIILGQCEIELTWNHDPGNENTKEEADCL
jgi:hypothetical protein